MPWERIPDWKPGDPLVFGRKPGTSFWVEPPPPPVPVPPEPGMYLCGKTRSYEWSTQTDSCGYARRAAEDAADIWRSGGYRAVVREVNSQYRNHHDWYGRPFSTRSAEYEIWVAGVDGPCSPIDRRTLREWAADQWRRGSNPFAVSPTLILIDPSGRLGLKEAGFNA